MIRENYKIISVDWGGGKSETVETTWKRVDGELIINNIKRLTDSLPTAKEAANNIHNSIRRL